MVQSSAHLTDLRSTQVCFLDLQHAYEQALQHRRHPAIFRRRLEDYILKSQQLTETMRREYAQHTGARWCASRFEGWSVHTAMLKALRHVITHERPLRLNTVTLTFYPREALEKNHPAWAAKQRRSRFNLGWVYELSCVDRPFQAETFGPGLLLPVEPSAQPEFPMRFYRPFHSFVGYEFDWSVLTEDVRKHVEAGVKNDAVHLLLRTYPRLSAYFQFYESILRNDSLIDRQLESQSVLPILR